ncbi:uncharacterized protein LOC121191960 isoform X1 [Toxotes jaculatrix]|uniref:uncharacterized protein LOC121191960 isoform X1 n=1 Tax=Toxotes jaculatrix TaxID=941984 RepID=UPI001B3A80E0|nr:uncharacterized protein LOC121191960 isoform X1 [Toxotes jaculatrix]
MFVEPGNNIGRTKHLNQLGPLPVQLHENKMKMLLLFLLFFHGSSSVKHSLKFFFTGSSGLPNFPEFVGALLVDDTLVGYCDTKRKILEAKQEWMKLFSEKNPEHLEIYRLQCFENQPKFFKVRISDLKQLFSQSGGVHILQEIFGCEWDETTGEVTGFMQFGYDGEDFISFDLKTKTWIALKPEAALAKLRWDTNKAEIEDIERFLTQIFPEWLKAFLDYGKNFLLKTELPSVSLLQKTPSSPLSCHATGFYPDRAEVFWRKDGEELHEDVEHGEILPNHDGTFQMSVDLNISSVTPEDWGRYECVFHLSGVKEDIVTKLDKAVIRTNGGQKKPTDRTVLIIVPVVVFIFIFIFITVIGFMVHKKKKAKLPPSRKSNGRTKHLNQLGPLPVRLHQNKMKKLLLFLLFCHGSSSVKHSLKYLFTASSGLPNFPEVVCAALIDDTVACYCDTNRKILEPKQEWVKNYFEKNPHRLEIYRADCFVKLPSLFKTRIGDLKQLFNQSGGVHILQELSGCEWDETNGEVIDVRQFGYSGEDFISFDLKTKTWIALKPEAVSIKLRWDADTAEIEDTERFLTQFCPDWLKNFVDYGKNFLLKTDLPSVSLLQKTPSSPLSCHATGFFPDRAEVFWRKDGEELHEDVEHGEILPNHDGTFQMSVDLNISSVTPEDWGRYECVFHLSGVKEDIVTKLDKAVIRTNGEKPTDMTVLIIVPVVVFIFILITVIGFMVHKKKKAKLPPSRNDIGRSKHLNQLGPLPVPLHQNKMKKLFLFLLFCHGSSSVKHSLKFFFTASSGLPNFPEVAGALLIDDTLAGYCDTNTQTVEPKQEWVKSFLEKNPQHLEIYRAECFVNLPSFLKAKIGDLKQLFNQSGGVHILQMMSGCEWDKAAREVIGFNQFGYNGEDFIKFNLNTQTWIALEPQAVNAKPIWDADETNTKTTEQLLTHVFPEWLKTFVDYGKSSLLKTERPSVSLLQKTPSSPLSCHATGFYPDRAEVFWRKDGEELHEDVEHGEILPNHDGTFQMSVDLNISSVTPEDWRRYECVFHLSGVKEDIVTKLDKAVIRTNGEKPTDRTVLIIVPLVVFIFILIFITVIGFMVHKKKKAKLPPSPSDNDTELSTELNPET